MFEYKTLTRLTCAVIVLGLPFTAQADEKPEFTLTIKDHLISPAELKVPVDKAFVLIVKNEDATPEEFESDDIGLEKVIPGNNEAKLNVPPLDKGEYKVFGEFNEDTAQGIIIAE